MTSVGQTPFERVPRRRLYEQIVQQLHDHITHSGLRPGDRLPPERELAKHLGVSRASLAQALVALEVLGLVSVRHGDGAVIVEHASERQIVTALRAHRDRLPEIIEARAALEVKLASLAAERRTGADLRAIDAALEGMDADIASGGRGVAGDEAFHAAVTAAGHSQLLARLMTEISDLIRESRLESLAQPGRPSASLAGHRRIAEAIRAQLPSAAATAMHDHIELVSDVAMLRDDDVAPG
ncbi:MAG TPA: FadR/GntR family transcriptional regulator [Actinomycetales bacterium]|nr:FadR/GntR family transcriptional regulator [Actinomycetales bacterium]